MGKSLPPLAGDGAPMKKMLAFFSWEPGKVAAGRKGEYKTSIYPAWRLPANPVFIPLGGCPRTQCSPRLARTQSRIVHGKIPSPACGGRGSHEKNARIFFMGTREGGRRPEGGNTKPAFIPLGGFLLAKKPACAGFSRRGKTLYSVAMSITKRYLTSLFSIRS